MKETALSYGLKGYALVSVINHDGSVAMDYGKFRNLWLDQGLDSLAGNYIPDAFNVCSKGDATTPQEVVKEVPAGSNTYSLVGNVITRTAGTRDFTSDDIGKLIRGSTGVEAVITSVTSATVVDVAAVGSTGVLSNYTNHTAIFYSVQLTGLTNEAFKRDLGFTASKTEGVATVTASGNLFLAGDVGECIYLGGTSGDPFSARYVIAAYVSATEVTVTSNAGTFTDRRCIVYTPQPGDESHTPLSRTSDYSSVAGENSTADLKAGGPPVLTGTREHKRTFIFPAEPEVIEYRSTDDGGTFTWAATTVTRTAGARNFTTADIGKYLGFTGGQFCKVTARSSNTVVTVDRAPIATITSGTLDAIYGFNQYDSVGFSFSDDPDANLNVLIRLEDGSGNIVPVLLAGPNPDVPGQQLKVTYVCDVELSPVAITARVAAPITDSANVMGANKFYTSVIEQIALASIDASGATQSNFAVLEPFEAGSLGLSPVAAALVALSGPDRSGGSFSTMMTADGYTAGQFTQLYEATLQINDAVATNWRSVGIFDTDTLAFGFTMLFEANQAKPGTVIITMRFRKTWNRDLS